MNLFSLLFAAVAVASVDAGQIHHDKVQSFAQPEAITISQKAAVQFKPSLQINKGCHPYPAVNGEGETSGGLKPTGPFDGKCKGSGLGSQVYARSMWYKGDWAIMYAWYFPKDQGDLDASDASGSSLTQRHRWLNVVVWLNNPAIKNPKILAISTLNWKGHYDVLHNAQPICDAAGECTPEFGKYINGTHPILSFENRYWLHLIVPTTDKSRSEFQDLIMWDQLPQKARDGLSTTDFGENAKVPFIDANFNRSIEIARLNPMFW